MRHSYMSLSRRTNEIVGHSICMCLFKTPPRRRHCPFSRFSTLSSALTRAESGLHASANRQSPTLPRLSRPLHVIQECGLTTGLHYTPSVARHSLRSLIVRGCSGPVERPNHKLFRCFRLIVTPTSAVISRHPRSRIITKLRDRDSGFASATRPCAALARHVFLYGTQLLPSCHT